MKRYKGTVVFESRPAVISYASVVGKKEGEGPLRDYFDRIVHDSYAGKDTFEQAESELMSTAVRIALHKGRLSADEIGAAYCGDLLNQCVASSFAMRSYGIPYAGVYGACSTMALAMITAATAIESGAVRRALCSASSHYCTAERQYRFPLEYGSQRPPTAQWTVTGAGACVLSRESVTAPHSHSSTEEQPQADEKQHAQAQYPYLAAARLGKIVDYDVTDQNNMGAAMAPAVVKLGTKLLSVFYLPFSADSI